LLRAAKDKSWSAWKRAVEAIRWLEKKQHQERQQVRYRRILRQLADMSNARFFEDEHLHSMIKNELTKHAIPALARRLHYEPDLEARESLARALANLGGREAADALVRAVVEED
jgi:HEAT repeat protein